MSELTQKRNVLMVIPNYGFGGAQRVYAQLVNSFSDQYNIIEVVFNADETDAYKGRGEKVSLNVSGGSNLFSKGINFIKRCKRLNRLKNKYQCIVSISHLEGANYVNILSFGCGKKILCVHGSKTAEDSNRKGLIKFIENRILIPVLFKWAYKIVTVSHGISTELIRFFHIPKAKIKVIHNGVDIDSIWKLSEEEIPDRHASLFNKQVVVFSGRLAPQKNPVSLIDIFKKSMNEVDYNLLILGDGPLKRKMQRRCLELGLDFYDEELARNINARIFFLGFEANPFKYLKKCTLFILPSDFEGFPLAPCEALACELSVIATDCPTGTREILAPDSDHSYKRLFQPEFAKYGVLMPLLREGNYNHNVDLWSQTLVKMITDKNLSRRYRNNSKERAMELSEEVFIKKWKELLLTVVA
jgi:glycosyltransferase involved in cell wall biosynthesis